jgi:hypothetical protein
VAVAWGSAAPAEGRRLDLSDEGLLADLEDRIEGSEQMLAIDGNGESSGH